MSEPDKSKDEKSPENEKPFATKGQLNALWVGGLTVFWGSSFCPWISSFEESSGQKYQLWFLEFLIGGLAGVGLLGLFKYLKRKRRS